MAQRVCTACNGPVTDSTKVCPHCSADISATAKSGGCLKWGLIGGGVFIVLGIIGSIAGGGKPSGSPSTTVADSAEAPAAIEYVKVSARELSNAYEANEAAAQQRFGDKPLEVSGTIEAIELDIADKPTVRLAAGNFKWVSASLNEASQPKAATLAKGQKIVLRCEEVTEVISIPQLKECSF